MIAAFGLTELFFKKDRALSKKTLALYFCDGDLISKLNFEKKMLGITLFFYSKNLLNFL